MSAPTSKTYTFDEDGYRHAPSCANPQGDPTIDAECDCEPCNTCEGGGQYGDDEGKMMDCLECENIPRRTHRGLR